MHTYYVLVKFNSEEEVEDPESYVESAVAFMRGGMEESTEFSIDGDSVRAMSVDDFSKMEKKLVTLCSQLG